MSNFSREFVDRDRGLTFHFPSSCLVQRFIRVKWYSQFERLDCEDGELEANVRLEPNGCLNLTRIENMWGIDRSIVSSVAPDRVWLWSFSFGPPARSCFFVLSPSTLGE